MATISGFQPRYSSNSGSTWNNIGAGSSWYFDNWSADRVCLNFTCIPSESCKITEISVICPIARDSGLGESSAKFTANLYIGNSSDGSPIATVKQTETITQNYNTFTFTFTFDMNKVDAITEETEFCVSLFANVRCRLAGTNFGAAALAAESTMGSFVFYNDNGNSVKCEVYCNDNGIAKRCDVYYNDNGKAVKT